MNLDQFLSTIRGLLNITGAILTARGATNAASIVNSQDVIGLAMILGAAIWSWHTHKDVQDPTAKPGGTSTGNSPALNILVAGLGLCGLLYGLTGCGTLEPAGVYQGDKVLYSADLTITTSYDLIHTYVSWEKENRAALQTWPQIRQSADVMRAKAPQWFSTAHALRAAYASSPTPENRDALQTALNVLHTALSEATKYMAQATQ